MKRSLLGFPLLFAWIGLACGGKAPQTEGPVTLDLVTQPKLLTTHFARYGYQSNRTIHRDWGGVRIQLPPTEKKTEQTGVYSYFAMAGEFEVTAGFELFDIPEPGKGYGASVGIGIDSESPEGLQITLHRGNYPRRGSGFWLTVSRDKESKEESERKENQSRFFLGRGETGKLSLKRDKDEVVCLISDDFNAPLKEIDRVPFPHRTIRVFRAFADNGGTSEEVDGRIVGIKITADSVTGGIPDPESSGWGWIVWIVGPIALVILGGVWWQSRS